jgi:hypothetical protein
LTAKARVMSAGLFSFCADMGGTPHAASVFSTNLIQYDVPWTIASSLKL